MGHKRQIIPLYRAILRLARVLRRASGTAMSPRPPPGFASKQLFLQTLSSLPAELEHTISGTLSVRSSMLVEGPFSGFDCFSVFILFYYVGVFWVETLLFFKCLPIPPGVRTPETKLVGPKMTAFLPYSGGKKRPKKLKPAEKQRKMAKYAKKNTFVFGSPRVWTLAAPRSKPVGYLITSGRLENVKFGQNRQTKMQNIPNIEPILAKVLIGNQFFCGIYQLPFSLYRSIVN